MPRRSTVTTFTVVLALATFFAAKGISHLTNRPSEIVPELTVPIRAALPSTWDPAADGRAILKRNMFDSHTGPMRWRRVDVPAVPPPAPEQLALVQELPARCEGDVRLLGSVVIAREPARSFAMVRWQGKSHVVQVGETLGERQLIALRSAGAYLQSADGPVCMLPLFLPASERVRPNNGVARTSGTKHEDGRRAAGFTAAELDRAIHSVGKDRFRVERQFMERAIGRAGGFARAGRFVPYPRKGQPIGMKAYGIPRDSLLYRLGVRNGDVLRSINGVPVGSAGGMLEAYTMLRGQAQLSLALVRRGQHRTLFYAVQ